METDTDAFEKWWEKEGQHIRTDDNDFEWRRRKFYAYEGYKFALFRATQVKISPFDYSFYQLRNEIVKREQIAPETSSKDKIKPWKVTVPSGLFMAGEHRFSSESLRQKFIDLWLAVHPDEDGSCLFVSESNEAKEQ